MGSFWAYIPDAPSLNPGSLQRNPTPSPGPLTRCSPDVVGQSILLPPFGGSRRPGGAALGWAEGHLAGLARSGPQHRGSRAPRPQPAGRASPLSLPPCPRPPPRPRPRRAPSPRLPSPSRAGAGPAAPARSGPSSATQRPVSMAAARAGALRRSRPGRHRASAADVQVPRGARGPGLGRPGSAVSCGAAGLGRGRPGPRGEPGRAALVCALRRAALGPSALALPRSPRGPGPGALGAASDGHPASLRGSLRGGPEPGPPTAPAGGPDGPGGGCRLHLDRTRGPTAPRGPACSPGGPGL